MQKEKILLVHWAPDPENHVGACGEECEVSYIDGRHKYYRHVYVTLSRTMVNCKVCLMALSIEELAKVKL